MGWFNREELPPSVLVMATPEQLAQLTRDLNQAWEFGLSDLSLAYEGLPLRVLWSEDTKRFRVTIPGEYVKVLNGYIPAATVGERYGDAYST